MAAIEGEVNLGEPAIPRPAAALILVRTGGKHDDNALQVLLVKRNPSSSFMPEAWVFPGGAVDSEEAEGGGDLPLRKTAIRELAEEASVQIESPEQLVPFARWITPTVLKKRFDTSFYIAKAPPHTVPKADGEETVDARWFKPAVAVEQFQKREIELAFPTVKQLEDLASFTGVEELLRSLGTQMPEPIQPRIVAEEDSYRIIMPTEPGYEQGV